MSRHKSPFYRSVEVALGIELDAEATIHSSGYELTAIDSEFVAIEPPFKLQLDDRFLTMDKLRFTKNSDGVPRAELWGPYGGGMNPSLLSKEQLALISGFCSDITSELVREV